MCLRMSRHISERPSHPGNPASPARAEPLRYQLLVHPSRIAEDTFLSTGLPKLPQPAQPVITLRSSQFNKNSSSQGSPQFNTINTHDTFTLTALLQGGLTGLLAFVVWSTQPLGGGPCFIVPRACGLCTCEQYVHVCTP